MNEEHKKENSPEVLTIDLKEEINTSQANRKNFGYGAFSKIYHELEIDDFFNNRQRSLDVSYSLNNIVKLLVFSRIINPCSKKKTFESKELFFKNSNFSLVDIYRALSHINKFKDALQLFIYEHITQQYGRNTNIVYYDVTNYYFEIDDQDNLRRKGVSKEHRKDPIVQMGLLMDTLGIPIAYKLFSGNENDCTTLIPVLKEIRRNFNLGRLVIVADKGLNYDKRAKAEREATIRKAREFIKSPSKYNNAISYGSAKYIKNLKIDKETGEIVDKKVILESDEKKLKEEEKYDGYYAIVTSEWKESDDRIIEIYRGLWKIEESFKIAKSDLEARPVYVSREDRIQSHFLICFISLVIT